MVNITPAELDDPETRIATAADIAAYVARQESRRAERAVRQETRRAERAARQETRRAERTAQRANGPTARLRALEAGASVLLPQYQRTAQLGPLLQPLRDRGWVLVASRERAPDGALLGVRVTRAK